MSTSAVRLTLLYSHRIGLRPFISVLAVALVAISMVGSAEALIVGNIPGTVPATNVNPVGYPGWTAGDPGWDNASAAGSNFVYLGDGWVLSARHVGYSATSGVSLQTYLPDGSPGPVKSFLRIPGNYYFDYGYGSSNVNTRQYAVSNPATIMTEAGPSISLAASNGTLFTDLQLFRISEDPGLPAVSIASAAMPSEFVRSNAPEVVFIGNGRTRLSDETHWNVVQQGTDSDGSPHMVWTETAGAGNYQGYETNTTSVHRFGANRLTDIRPNFNGDPIDNGAINYTQNPNKLFEPSDIISDTTGAFPLKTSDGVTRDVISMMTVFDNQTSPGDLELETQAIAGNSGSSVFYKRGDQWELVGIVHAISTLEDQPARTGIYGNATIVSDLWHYMQDYEDSIFDIMRDHSDYSHQGDINLSGTVTGDGTGSTASDDIAAFVAGWGFNNGRGVGNVDSWKKGDLNKDGITNVQDFLKLRRAFHGEIPEEVITTLFGEGGGPVSPGGVPEPGSALLFAAGAGMLMFRARLPRW
jgi:hypothetical protein